jgi:transcriptional regulator with GAF, ATPase, and Fis domain
MSNHEGVQDSDSLQQLQRLLIAIEASGHAILPRSNDELLKSIVEAAARIFRAAAASILLVSEKERLLEFKVAYGKSDHELVGQKFPLDKGIAGYVVLTGQPLAISNVRQDARFNQDFAKSTGYVPTSILAMPLKSGDHVIGVMEVLDKIDAASFGMQDMELLGMFAHQASISIEQSQKLDNLQEAFTAGLKKLISTENKPPSRELLAALDPTKQPDEVEFLISLADMFYKISHLGEAEQKACMDILKIFADYQHTTRKTRYVR